MKERIRTVKITPATSCRPTPTIRLSGRWLQTLAGFEVGRSVTVVVQQGQLIIVPAGQKPDMSKPLPFIP